MSENPEEVKKTDELKKLANIATDMEFSGKMRAQAINQVGEIGSHEALLVLLSLAANDKLSIDDRDLALKRAREIIKKGR
jgi:hypothetical protein